MKPIFLSIICAAICALEPACSTLSREQLASYNQPGVPASLAARMDTGAKLSLPDIVDLSHSGMRSGEIILYLADSDTGFDLTPEQVQNLRDEGVSGDVITYLREKPNDTGGWLSMF